MISLRPLAGAILTSVLLAGLAAGPAAASTRDTASASSASSALTAARPGNGTLLYDRLSSGQGTLKIKNGTGKDAVVTLVRGRSKAISLYIRARSNASTDVVEDGTYRIYFTSGYKFSTAKGRFTQSAVYQRFDDRLKFTTTSSSSTIWTLTLNPVRNGNARTSGVDPDDFPA
ncbi:MULTISPECIES: hypothetical protein [Streptosporangium]|uniref:Uncharacterized protein n=1 Tax=Streptosporangium brasiliense TaxID=47480 RepID=A0ABT9R777_9ACTN|nr:hypothetical protein [Streptosporangium brasiliense]MDP9864727.1 hypothetical protein [Streptosporangium brasiliense]